jgi:outer membrane protein assembly factor BamB
MSGPSKRNTGGLWLATVVGAAMTLTGVTPAAAAARAPGVTASGWPQFQGGAAHAGTEPGENSITAANVSQLRVAWTVPIPAAQSIDTSEVLVVSGSAYVSTANEVIALDAVTGATLWQATLPAAADGTPAVQGGMVLTRYSLQVRRIIKSYVVALDSTTGATVWTRRVSDGGDSLTTTAHRVYVTVDNQVEALGLAHGFKRWQSAALPGCGGSSPSVADGVVVVGDGGTNVSALNAATGAVTWEDTFGTGCGSSGSAWLPAIRGGTVYAGLLNGVAALSLSTGAVLWHNHAPANAGVFFPLSMAGGSVIAGPNGGGEIAALGKAHGAVRWRDTDQVAGTATFGPLVWGNLTTGAGNSGGVTAYDPATGHQLFSAPQPADNASLPPTVADGRVYVNLGNEVECLALPATATG